MSYVIDDCKYSMLNYAYLKGEMNMIYLLVFIAGLLLACMQSFNGLLSNYIGSYGTSLIVHLIGAFMLIVYLMIKKEKIKLYPMPWYLYTAGIFGLLLVAFTSVSVAVIGASLTTCLSITGQIFCSIVIDHTGAFGLKKMRFQKERIPCLMLILTGLVVLLIG